MTHDQLENIFILDFQQAHPEARIFKNRTGKAKIKKDMWIPYGMPPETGGSDLMAFYMGGITEFYEIKTLAYPDQSKTQKIWASFVTRFGFKYFIVRETGGGYAVELFHV